MDLKSLARRAAAAPRRVTRSLPNLVLVLLPLAGCSDGVLQPKGPVAAANAKILLDAMGIMLAVVVPTIGATLAFAWWFRASNSRARYRPDWVYSGRIELIVWGIPLLVILFLGGLIWIGARELDPYKAHCSR
jgi:cytochrome o ubiquinol oxidase subunit 2